MTLSKLTTDLSNISALVPEPNDVGGLTAASLQSIFDKAGNDIKDFINNTLTVETDAKFSDVEGAGRTTETVKGNADNLATHKTSEDHDGRYYTETEVDAMFETISDLENNRKLAANGNFTGSWHGISNPALADPGIAGVVESHTAQLADITKQRGITLQELGCHQITEAGYETFDSGAVIDAYLRNPLRTASKIIFTPGIWKANINNNQSNMTFEFQDGCIIDGVFHFAVGSGPDVSPNPAQITYVENVKGIGNCVSTVRVGGYYCKNINIDKITILDNDAQYPNQTAQGGAQGFHFYLGVRNLTIGEIIVKNSAQYGVAFDIATTINPDHYSEDITVGKIIVEKCQLNGFNFNNTKNLKVGEIIIKQYGLNLADNHRGAYLFQTHGFCQIDLLDIEGASSVGLDDGVYSESCEYVLIKTLILNGIKHYGINNQAGTNMYIETAKIKDTASIGIYNFADSFSFGTIEIKTCGSNGILSTTKPVYGGRLKIDGAVAQAVALKDGHIEYLEVINGSNYGVRFNTITGAMSFGKIVSHDNALGNVYILSTSGFKANFIECINATKLAGKIGVELYGATGCQIGQVYVNNNGVGFKIDTSSNIAIESIITEVNDTGISVPVPANNSNITVVTRRSISDTVAESGDMTTIAGFKGL